MTTLTLQDPMLWEHPVPVEFDDRDPLVRLDALCDFGTFVRRDQCDGAAAGVGRLDGALSVVFATDARVQGGALGVAGCALIVRAYQLALDQDIPVVGVWHSGGARLREGAASLDGVGRMFAAMIRASGVIPQVSLILGPAAGGAAYGPALTDIVVMGPEARVMVTGPDVVRSVTGENLDAVALGGPDVHGRYSGVAHVTATSDEAAISQTRRIVGLLAHAIVAVSGHETVYDPAATLPDSARRAYDVHPVLDALLDEPGQELHKRWAPNVVTMLGRLHGRTVGVVANNPIRMAGCLNAPASDKAARFVRMCDAFGIPLVVIVDVPGYLPGSKQETEGIVRRGAKLLHAFSAARVPRVTVVTRKAYGGAFIAMNSKSLGATRVFAWPGAQLDVMNPLAAVRILNRRDLRGLTGDELAAAEQRLADAHAVMTGGLNTALSEGLIDAVIEPIHTRDAIAAAIHSAQPGRGRLTNIPL